MATDDEEQINASDAEQVKKRNRDLGRKARERKQFLQQIMRSREGRDWIFGLLGECHIFATSMSSDALLLAFAEGERNIGLKIYSAIISADSRLYVTMLEEHDPNARSS